MNYKEFATQDTAQVFAGLGSGEDGLSSAVAVARLAETGPNKVPRAPQKAARLLLRQISSPMALVLVAAFATAVLVGDRNSAITIFIFLFINAFLGFIQEYRSEKYVKNLEKMLTPTVVARRDGEWKRIPRENIVAGDLVALRPGDAVPADCRLIRTEDLLVDESSLTGESVPAEKSSKPMAKEPGSPTEASNIVFAGAMVIAGSADAAVFATGARTSLGKISSEAMELKRSSIFEKNISAFTKFMVKIVVITLGAVYIANLLIKGSAADPWELLLFSMALAVSVIPEAMPAIMAVTFSKGAMILARKKMVVKRLSAIEDLGHIEILCTDKTGTITQNKLSVSRVSCADANACVLAALMSGDGAAASVREVSSFDAAIWRFASDELRGRAKQASRLAVMPFDPVRRRNSSVVEYDGRRMMAIKGAPEDVFDLCRLTGSQREKFTEEFRNMGREGMRVLAVASREVGIMEEYGPADEQGAAFLGLIGFIDELKPKAKAAIAAAEALKVRVKIVSGDSPEVTAAVGVKVGIIGSLSEVVTGPELEAMDEDGFNAAVLRFDVMARITPELKYRIVNSLEREHATGFLGEGFNDAPALKSANVAMVVAEASDIAREEADVVLLDRSLDVVIDGIREGRTIYANILKYIRYTMVANFGNFYSMAIISLFIDFLPLLPSQILLLNLISDYPLIAIATDLVSDEDLATPHRFSVRDIAIYTTVLGLVSSLFDFIFFGVFRHASEQLLQTAWFTISVLTEIVSIFSLRTDRFFLAVRRPSVMLIAFSAMAAAAALLIPYTGWGKDFFKLVPLSPGSLAIILAIVLAYLVSTEAAKLAYARFWKKTAVLVR